MNLECMSIKMSWMLALNRKFGKTLNIYTELQVYYSELPPCE